MTAVSLWRKIKFSRKGRLRHCILLISLVIAPVVCALIFSESMMNGITNKYICLSDGHMQLNSTEFNANDYSLGDSIYSSDKVVSGYVLLYSSSSTQSCQLKGVESSYFNDKRKEQLTFEYANEPIKGLNGITISRETAKNLNVKVGDKIALIAVQDSGKMLLRPSIVYVNSIFYTGYSKLDELICFTNFEFAESLFSSSNPYTEIIVNDEYTDKLDFIENLIDDKFIITRWTDHNAYVYSNFIASREAIFIILSTIIVVAAFFTVSVAQQLIQDDYKDIATIKLVGGSDALVRKWAFTTVFSVTIAGSLIGTACGILLGYLIGPLLKYISSLGLEGFSHYLLDFNVTIPVLQIVKILLIMITLSSIAIFLSLNKTRRIKPIQLFTE